MAITNGYTTLNEYKARFYGADETDDHIDDAIIEVLITAASRAIDNICDRRFYANTETRYYTPEDNDYLRVDDLLSVTTLKTDEDGDRTYEITWQTTDYDLMPFNASADSWPYRWIETTPEGDNTFPCKVSKSVEIAGSWGFASATPPAIQEACLLAANRIRKRDDAPLGVSAMAALGELNVVVRRLEQDPDFMLLVGPYIRRW